MSANKDKFDTVVFELTIDHLDDVTDTAYGTFIARPKKTKKSKKK